MNTIKNSRQLKDTRLITTLFDNSQLIFAEGRFDRWCIYRVTDQGQYAIKDIEVFSVLHKYSNSIERFKLYSDFISIFNKVTSEFDCDLILKIKEISKSYINYSDMEFVFSFLYAGMVAEENKRFAVLKKYVKRLGVHQVLIEGVAPQVAATYSKGKNCKELKLECGARGFSTNDNFYKLRA